MIQNCSDCVDEFSSMKYIPDDVPQITLIYLTKNHFGAILYYIWVNHTKNCLI